MTGVDEDFDKHDSKLLPFYGFDQNFIHRVLESLLLYMLID
jgi:hypothetical protein